MSINNSILSSSEVLSVENYYHVTTSDRLDSILKNGLDPEMKNGEFWKDIGDRPKIHLYGIPSRICAGVQLKYVLGTESLAILRIPSKAIAGMHLELDDEDAETIRLAAANSTDISKIILSGGAVVCYDRIPPDAIVNRGIFTGVDKMTLLRKECDFTRFY